MSRQCSIKQEPISTESIDLDEVAPFPEEKNFALLRNGTPIYVNYLQAVNRLFVDVQTADVFSALKSKQKNIFDYSNLISPHSISPLLFNNIQELLFLIDQLDFDLRNKQEIIYFLLEHPELFSVTKEAQQKIRNYFPYSPLILEVVTDPEEKESQILFIYIQTTLSVTEALSRLNQLDEAWWLDVSKEIGEFMCINLEYL